VTKDAAPCTMAGGNTARPLRRRHSEAAAEQMMELAWWGWSHEALRAALPDFRKLRAEAFLEKYS